MRCRHNDRRNLPSGRGRRVSRCAVCSTTNATLQTRCIAARTRELQQLGGAVGPRRDKDLAAGAVHERRDGLGAALARHKRHARGGVALKEHAARVGALDDAQVGGARAVAHRAEVRSAQRPALQIALQSFWAQTLGGATSSQTSTAARSMRCQPAQPTACGRAVAAHSAVLSRMPGGVRHVPTGGGRTCTSPRGGRCRARPLESLSRWCHECHPARAPRQEPARRRPRARWPQSARPGTSAAARRWAAQA